MRNDQTTARWLCDAAKIRDDDARDSVMNQDMPLHLGADFGNVMRDRMRGGDKSMFLLELRPRRDGKVILTTRYVAFADKPSEGLGSGTLTGMLTVQPQDFVRASVLCDLVNDRIEGERFMLDGHDCTVYSESVIHLNGDKAHDSNAVDHAREAAIHCNMLYLPFIAGVRKDNFKRLAQAISQTDRAAELANVSIDFNPRLEPVDSLQAMSRRTPAWLDMLEADDHDQESTLDQADGMFVTMRMERSDYSGRQRITTTD